MSQDQRNERALRRGSARLHLKQTGRYQLPSLQTTSPAAPRPLPPTCLTDDIRVLGDRRARVPKPCAHVSALLSFAPASVWLPWLNIDSPTKLPKKDFPIGRVRRGCDRRRCIKNDTGRTNVLLEVPNVLRRAFFFCFGSLIPERGRVASVRKSGAQRGLLKQGRYVISRHFHFHYVPSIDGTRQRRLPGSCTRRAYPSNGSSARQSQLLGRRRGREGKSL